MAPVLLLLLLFQQVAPAPSTVNVKTFEDIEIGMPETVLIGSLIRAGYTVEMPKPGAGPGRFVRLNGQHSGTFWVDSKGNVSAAEEPMWYSSISDSNDSAIALGEALYWVIHDEATGVLNEKDRASTVVADVELGTDDFISRNPGTSIKRLSIRTKSGALYLISLNRNNPQSWSVEITKVAPFPKKKQ